MKLLVDRKLSQMASMERVTQVMTLVLSLLLSKLFMASFVKTDLPALGRRGKVWAEKGCANTEAGSLGRVL